MVRNGQRERLTVLFGGGGTGGHLMPGLSVAEELRRRFGACARLAFVGTPIPLERRMVERRGFEFFALPSIKLPGELHKMPEWAWRAAGAFAGARRLIAQTRPDVVVSLGGYAAFAPSVVAAFSRVPLVLMEQNALPGKVNRSLGWLAREIYAPWPGMEGLFVRPERVVATGNPVRRDLAQRRNALQALAFNLNPKKKTLLVMGGSQGAQFINRAMIEALPLFEAESSWLQVLHGAGEGGYEECRAAYARSGVQATVLPFIEDMASAYAMADLALCRAGGTTLAELTALGVPAVLVPLPSAANDHQRRNADLLAGAGAALLVEQNDLSGGRLAAVLMNLLRNDVCLARMRAASLRLGRPSATQTVADRLLDLCGNRLREEAPAPIAAAAAEGE